MSSWLRRLLVLGLSFLGLSLAAQEVVVFKDFRALVVQSHRVDGAWTYLRVGAGEMAVPSATILQVTQESGQIALVAPRPAPPPQSSQGFRPERPTGQPPRMEPPAKPVPNEQADEDADTGSGDEGDEEEAPPPPVPTKPNIPQSLTPRPAPFPIPAPVETKDKDD